jgi:hypothetical protein
MILYLAGPMAGYQLHNFPAFVEATARLRRLNYERSHHGKIELAVARALALDCYTYEPKVEGLLVRLPEYVQVATQVVKLP